MLVNLQKVSCLSANMYIYTYMIVLNVNQDLYSLWGGKYLRTYIFCFL